MAVLAHLTPFTALLAIVRGDAFARAHGRAALRFHVSLTAYLAAIVVTMHATAGTLLGAHLAPFLLFFNLMLVLNWLLLAAVAIQRAATGQTFTYPMTIGRT
jgi:uncharacterized Tic20 family protein